jgi:hypothetical protein
VTQCLSWKARRKGSSCQTLVIGRLHPQFDPLSVEALEEPDAGAEQYGDEVELQLVQQSGLQVLPHDVRAAPDAGLLVAGGGTSQLECGRRIPHHST